MRRRNTLVEATQAAGFPDMEFVLLRCPKFFAKENLATVFPEAAHVATALSEATAYPASVADHEAYYYLLYTFQPCDFVMERVSDDDSDGQGLSSNDEPSTTSSSVSPFIQPAINKNAAASDRPPSPPVLEWKDRSRDRVYKFMALAKRRVHDYLAESVEALAGDAPTTFFMDWPDPATGLPACTMRGATTFSDADTVEQFFPFKKVMVAGPGGGCYMVEHPRFGLNVYLDAAVLVVPHVLEEKLREAVLSLGVQASI